MAKTMDQRRAAHAYEAAQRGAGTEEFRTMVKKVPVLVRTCGLGHAVAFLEAKRKAPTLSAALDDWIATAIPGQGKLLERIVKEDGDFLQRATDESLAYLFWLVRFTESAEKAVAKKAGQ
jgi:CRISPR/Cas system CMR-associated protein Cmr5 small subunit